MYAVKMNPPGVPEVNTTANDTFISWSAGSPRSKFITSFDFHVQIKQINQPWKVRTDHHQCINGDFIII